MAERGALPELRKIRNSSEIYSLHPQQDDNVKELIDRVGKEGDTLGGIVEVRVDGLPIGLGTHAQWDRKLDGQLAQAVMAVQAIKGVEIGMGFETARRPGSRCTIRFIMTRAHGVNRRLVLFVLRIMPEASRLGSPMVSPSSFAQL